MDNNIEKKIHKLAELRNSPFPILSIYLGYAAKQSPSFSMMLTQLHSLISQNLSMEERKWFRKDLERIESYLKQIYNKNGVRSLAFFSAGKNLWEVLHFEFYLSPLCMVSYSPYLKPVTDALDKYKKYLVVLVDREKGRLFTVYLGKVEEQKDFFEGEVPQKVKAKKIDWGRDDKIFRHTEDHLRKHLKFIAEKVREFTQGNQIHFLIIGGHKQLIPKMKKYLSYPLNKMVVGEFITELNIPVNNILLHSKKVASKAMGEGA